MEARELIVSVSGPHGVGKSVYSRAVADKFGLRYHSSGSIFRGVAKDLGIELEKLSTMVLLDDDIDRKIDSRMLKEASKENVVFKKVKDVPYLYRVVQGTKKN